MLARTLVFIFLTFATAFHVETSGQEAPAKKAQAGANYRYWSTEWSFNDIDILDLAGKLRAIGIEIPVELAGRASVNFNVDVPINALRTGRAYRFRGTLKAKNLRAEEVTFQTLDATVNFVDGYLTLSDLRGTQGGGSFTGDAKAQLLPSGSFNASLELADLNASPIAGLLAKFGIGSESNPVNAIVSAKIDAAGKVDEINQPDRLNLSGEVNLSELSVGESMRYTASLENFELKNKRLSIADFTMTSVELPEFFLRAEGEARLEAAGSFNLKLETNDLPTTDLLGMYFSSPDSIVDGKIDFQGTAQGTFVQDKPLPELDVRLSIASPKLTVAGVDLGLLEHDIQFTDRAFSLSPRQQDSPAANDLIIQSISAKYQLEEESLSIDDVEMKLFGGVFEGNARLSRDGSGEHTVDSNWSNLQPRFPVKLLGDQRVFISGTTSGNVKWRVPADKLASPQFHRVKIDATIDPLSLGAEKLGDFTVQAEIEDSSLQVDAKGELFGGRMSIRTASPISSQAQWNTIIDRLLGEMRLENASLGKASQLIFGQRTRFSGAFSALVRFERMPGQPLMGRTILNLSRLSVGRDLVGRDLRLIANSEDTEIEIRSLQGAYAGGQLDASGRWSLADGERVITARIVRADGDRMLLPINDDARNWLGGIVSGRASVIGIGAGVFNHVRVTGSVRVDDTVTFNIPLGDATTPFVVDVQSSPLHWEAKFPVVNSRLANGQVKGHLNLSIAATPRGFDMDSDWRANHVDFEKLLSTYAGTSTIGQGNVTGNFSLGGTNIRTANDLKGHYRVTLGGTDATALPGLSSDSLLGIASLAGVSFSQGVSSGRITRGSLVVDEMALTSQQATLKVDGRISLLTQRLDMKAVIATGNFRSQSQLLTQLGLADGLNFLPIGQINRILSNRVLAIGVSGPLRDPIVQLLPGETLQATARQLLRGQVLAAIAISTALN